MPKSYYLDGNILNAVLRGIPYTSPVASYVALFTTSPTRAGGGVEVSGGSYARRPATWTAPSSGMSSNASDLEFPVASALWGTVTSYGLYDASVGGNLLYFADLNAPRLVQINDQMKFPTGQLQVIED
jgi:hypothetical protein